VRRDAELSRRIDVQERRRAAWPDEFGEDVTAGELLDPADTLLQHRAPKIGSEPYRPDRERVLTPPAVPHHEHVGLRHMQVAA
jgi:hypothetical protein